MHRPRMLGPHGESGAVLVIVTLSLFAMFGMMVLVIDVGSLLYARRALVNSADAAALAAAQSCGQKEGMGEASAQAEFYAVANENGAEVAPGYPRYFPNCDAPAGLVTVRVRSDQTLFFAPVLGADSDTPVTTEATASWGGAGVGEHVAPLMLSANRLSDCEIPPSNPNSVTEQLCEFWWNDAGGPPTDPNVLANAEWGTLDLANWDVDGTFNCPQGGVPPEFEEWMLEGYFAPLPINSPNPPEHTYVCRGKGNFGNSLDNTIRDVIDEDPPLFLYFPVNQPESQVDRDGAVCSPEMALSGCSVQKYDIIGFARLQILEIYRGRDAWEHCPDIPVAEQDANARCMITKWVGYSSDGLDPQGGENFGLVPVRLVK
jgi:Putative Flp pilus-assembly TadE/G-like